MACLQMILSQKLHRKISLVELGEKCLEYGGYTINHQAEKIKDYKNYYNGLFYKPFTTFVKNEYKLNAEILSPMVYKEIIQALDINNFVIASVHPSIRNPESSPTDRRGHLVLIVGYDITKNIFYLHNPSGFYNTSQKFAEISIRDFNKFFANRGIKIQNY